MHDDVDLIRSYRSDVDSDDAARAAARKTLRGHIEAETSSAPSGRAKRRIKPARRLAWSLALLLVAASGAAAASLVLTSDDVSLGSVACLDSPRTIDSSESGRAVFVEPGDDPVAACARVWRAGHIGDQRDGTPELVACASAGKPIVVVPGGPGTCADLELEPLPGDYAASASALGRAKHILQRDWDLKRPLSACDEPETALSHARNLLQAAGVGDVRVELAGDGPCAGAPGFSEGGTVVRLDTVSRQDAAENYEYRRISTAQERRRISTALERLSAQSDCEDPQHAAARARRLLAAAGLAHISVQVENQGGPCFDPGGYEHAPATVTLRSTSRDQAAANATGQRDASTGAQR